VKPRFSGGFECWLRVRFSGGLRRKVRFAGMIRSSSGPFNETGTRPPFGTETTGYLGEREGKTPNFVRPDFARASPRV